MISEKTINSVTRTPMKREEAFEIFRKSIQSRGRLPDELIDQLFQISRVVHFEKDQFFLMAGEVPEYAGFNLRGIFRLFYVDDDANDVTKAFSTPGNFVLAYSALVQQRPSYFSIEAIADSTILQFNYSQWMKMVESDKRWYPFMFKILESAYINKEMREKSFLLDDARRRYLNFRKDYADLEDQIKLYHIASFIGITPETLSRIRKNEKLI